MSWWKNLFAWFCWRCNKDPTVAEVITSNEIFSTFAEVIESVGGLGTINGSSIGQITVFAPTDEAFDALDDSIKQRYLGDDQWNDHLISLLRYHTLHGSFLSDAFEDGMHLTTSDGSNLTVHTEPELSIHFFPKHKAFIVDPFDQKGKNGVVHAVGKVLLPPSATRSIGVLVLANMDTFSQLYDILQFAGLIGMLDVDEGAYTVFAPTNDAFDRFFDQLSPETILSLADAKTLQHILNYHVVEGVVTSASMLRDIMSSKKGDIDLETVQGGTVNVASGRFLELYVEDSKIVGDDVLAKNGVIHVIDSVLIPPDFAGFEVNEEYAVPGEAEDEQQVGLLHSIPEVAADLAQDQDLSTLVWCLETANLVDVLDGDGMFTLFAPNDAAFDALQDRALDSLLADSDELRKILLYHVLNEEILASDLTWDEELESMLEGHNITVEATNSSVILNGDAKVLVPDISAANGVIHIIDNVLLMPPLEDIPDIAEKSVP